MAQDQQFPPQHQPEASHGEEARMTPRPRMEDERYQGSGKLAGKVALITGGDSGIGRAVAIVYAKEGADVVIVYLNQDNDARETCARVEAHGRRCLALKGDLGEETFCQEVVTRTIAEFGQLDILVNNAAEQHPKKDLGEIDAQQLADTFRTNIFSMFYLTQAALPHLKPGAAIINTTSVTAYKGSGGLLDYASTKGAIVAFTRSLAQNLVERGIRVNGVAPGPIWTPLIVSTFEEEKIQSFGADVPMKRAGQPCEVAPSYVFLASDIDSSYITGQILHPNGGTPVGG